jgi:exopolyphosphatase/guanosine-5'-triphosphate,3'-diphosphate pyrophosphatase
VSYAAIDCGTNSTRLLVHDGTRTVERLMRITRLGQGVDATGQLAPDAIERTLGVLREYRSVIDRLGVTKTRMTASSAARDAANRDEFFVGARDIVGVEAELSGDEEGRLSFMARRRTFHSGRAILVVDIGGGSTEFVRRHRLNTHDRSTSAARLTEKYISHDPPRPRSCSRACRSSRPTWTTSPAVSGRGRQCRDWRHGIDDRGVELGLAGTTVTASITSS